MRFYLSSYKLGADIGKLQELVAGRRIGFIPNAIDFVTDEDARRESNERNMKDLLDIGIDVELLDLRGYAGRPVDLSKKLDTLGGVWVRGGNTFVLRQAIEWF